jgi:cytoskeleton protein RodZ
LARSPTSADRRPDGVGGKLRDARERRGVSLRQIANATKISVTALEALERNDISRLPGGIFTRAFVRSYALEVGLDADAMIQEFIAQFPNDSVTSGHPASPHVEDHQAVESDRRMAGTLLWLVLISVPIAGAVMYFGISGRRNASPAAAAPAPIDKPADPPPTPSVAPPAADAERPASPSAPEPAGQSPADAHAAVAATAADRLTVTLSVKRPCWVSATVDGQKAIDRLLQPGEQKTLEVRRELVLTAGDATAIALAFNGAVARPLGKAGEVVTARFNLTNFTDYLSQR